MKDDFDEVINPHDSDKDAFNPIRMKEPKNRKEMPSIRGLRDPDTLEKSKLVSHRYKEYR